MTPSQCREDAIFMTILCYFIRLNNFSCNFGIILETCLGDISCFSAIHSYVLPSSKLSFNISLFRHALSPIIYSSIRFSHCERLKSLFGIFKKLYLHTNKVCKVDFLTYAFCYGTCNN